MDKTNVDFGIRAVVEHLKPALECDRLWGALSKLLVTVIENYLIILLRFCHGRGFSKKINGFA